MKSPYFSVIIPTYNRLELLKKTLSSVLNQTFTDFEVLVVDNHSTDSTEEYMRSLTETRVRYFRNEHNEERAYSRNRGMSLAIGEFCTLLDSDDLMHAECLQLAMDFITARQDVRFFHGLYDIINHEGKKIKEISFEPLINPYEQICHGNFISCIAVFLNRDIYQRFQFSEDRRMIGSEDYEIWLRVLTKHPIHRMSAILCSMREHEGRSVYSDMYFNLEFQRKHIIKEIEIDPAMKEKYSMYLHLINTNFFYHQAMFYFNLGRVRRGTTFLLKSIQTYPRIILKRRFVAMIKAFLVALKSRAILRG